jgi:signal transduction histidine kinase/CheY-like chemotaxis protein
VLNKNSKEQVFTRYNLSVLGIFIIITFLAISTAIYRYFVELESFKLRELNALTQQAKQVEKELKLSAQSIAGMRKFANYYLDFPEELHSVTPPLVQDGNAYYLAQANKDVLTHRKVFRSSITGLGEVENLSLQQQQELAMVNALTPSFILAKNSIKEANWFYYVSLNRFVSIYPWISRQHWRYSDKNLNNSNIDAIRKSIPQQHKLIWSPPYVDTAGKGLNTALGTAIFRGDSLVGAILVDINLSTIHHDFPDLLKENKGILLLDENSNVLVHKTKNNQPLTSRKQWSEVGPEVLAEYDFHTLNALPDTFQSGTWLVQKYQLPSNGWIMLQYQSYQTFTAPIYDRFMFIFMVLFLGLFSLLSIIYFVTRKTFIEPTKAFIGHIEHCSQGDPGKVKPSPDWQHWFKIVEDIFGQNRSLLQQLKDQNSVLDSRVSEKTQALRLKSEQHQRDYALLRSVMDAIPEYIIFNDLAGNMMGYNQAFETFVNEQPENIIGQRSEVLLNNELGRALTRLSAESLQQLNTSSIQKIIETVDSTYDVFSAQLYSQTDEIVGSINLVRDVTQQYAANTALELAKNQAEHANQAKSQFLANMSHEIRTPINAIKGMLFLLKNTRLSYDQRLHINNADGASIALLYLVDELLDLAKIESGNMSIVKKQTSINAIIDQAIKLNIHKISQKDLVLNIDIAADVPDIVLTDEMRMVQVLTNLLSNAVKFTHKGSVSIHVKSTAKSETNALIRFTVIDTGIGIAKEKQANLFEAFCQADESMTREYGGSGLGLAICQHIVNLLEGEIKLSSEPMQGSEFSFVLPLRFPVIDPIAEQTKQADLLTLCVYQQSLPEWLVDDFIPSNMMYQQVREVSEFINYKSERHMVIIIDEQEVLTLGQALVESCLSCKALLVICQTMAKGFCNDMLRKLTEVKIPYMILENPLYRNIYQKIEIALISELYENKDKDQLALTTESKYVDNLQNVNVLLVEDNLVNQLVAKELLKTMKATVFIAENGQKALDVLDDTPIDIVLMDIQMPVMDGLTATQKIRQQDKFAHLPIIAMTAHARQEDKDRSLAAGMNMHVAKPVTAALLLSSMLSVLKKV